MTSAATVHTHALTSFPTRRSSDLNNTPAKLTQLHKRMAKKLEELHITESPYERLPEYNLRQLKRGICCHKCRSLMIRISYKKLSCVECGYKESIDSGVMRSVVEFSIQIGRASCR